MPALLAIVGTTLAGVLDECIQFFVPGRTFDWFDVLGDPGGECGGGGLECIAAVGATVVGGVGDQVLRARALRWRPIPVHLGVPRLRQLSLAGGLSRPRFTVAAPRFRRRLRRFSGFVFGYPAHRVLPREDKGGQNALAR